MEKYSNIKKSQININKNVEILPVNTYVIVSNIYLKEGNKLKVKYNSIGVRNIPGIIIGNYGITTYKVKILISYNDLKLNTIYDIEYKLLKKCPKNICDLLIKEYFDKIKIEINKNLENSKISTKLNNYNNLNSENNIQKIDINDIIDSSYLDNNDDDKLEINNKVDKNIDDELPNNKEIQKLYNNTEIDYDNTSNLNISNSDLSNNEDSLDEFLKNLNNEI